MIKYLLVILLALSFYRCLPDKKKDPTAQTSVDSSSINAPVSPTLAKKPDVPLPTTPETLVSAWEGWCAQNKFEYAAYVSDGKTLEYTESMVKAQAIEPSPKSIIQILDLHCAAQGDSATCNCTVKDNKYGDAYWRYSLHKKDSRWLIYDVAPTEAPKKEGQKENKKSNSLPQ